MVRSVLWSLATMTAGLALLAGIVGLTLALTMLATGPALAGEATIAAWREGSTFERELAWAALRASVGPGQAASMEVNRIEGRTAPVRKTKTEC